jgi:ketosteroid isomerase-like protein
MYRRGIFIMFAVAAMGISFLPNNAVAQQTTDIEGVKAASKAFYVALAVIDDGSAMDKVWAKKPYVTYVGPLSKSVTVGSDALKKMWVENNKVTEKRNISLGGAQIHANSNLAWEIGVETGESKRKDSPASNASNIVTNVYEKIDGRWLMVSHHAQRMPQ